jgi:2-oxo-4-hydroxy-4-carboxy--5-ureidoimidazoline (OHCU) decarboxylase
MKDIWTAQVHLLTPPADFGDTKCCTNVVAWAEDESGFIATVSAIFERRHWTILSVRQCKRVAECEAIIAELAEQIEEAKSKPACCIFGTLNYYPSKPA